MKPNSVLILTYYWPPAGGPGVQRWLKFVKYMRENGWDANILTVEDGTYSAIDEQLLDEVPEGIQVYKTKSRDPFRFYNMLKGKKDGSVSVALINIDKKKSLVDRMAMYVRSNFFIPDARKGWVPFAVKEALKIMEEKQIDIVVTTGPPHSTHLAGLKIKRKTGIKWLADLRDPWTTVYYNDMLPRTKSTQKKDKKLEDAVLENADAVSVVSPGMKKEFSDRNKNIHVVMNGFDMADMESKEVKADRDGKFRLTYTGNFKPNQHVPNIWNAICELITEHADFANDFLLSFVGNVDASAPDYFISRGQEKQLELLDYMPHHEATLKMQESSLLLFVVPQSKNNKLIITGKLFEYLASGTPILSVGPPAGDAAQILEETGRESMLNYNDKEAFKLRLYEYYKEWKKNKGELIQLKTDMLDAYSRRASAKNIAGIMDEMLKK